jgi:hypothetical protein
MFGGTYIIPHKGRKLLLFWQKICVFQGSLGFFKLVFHGQLTSPYKTWRNTHTLAAVFSILALEQSKLRLHIATNPVNHPWNLKNINRKKEKDGKQGQCQVVMLP